MIADFVSGKPAPGGRVANALALAVIAIGSLAGLFVTSLPSEVKPLLILLAICALLTLMVTVRSLVFSTLAVGIVPLIGLSYAGLMLMPLANEIASTKRLIAALQKQNVAAEQIALYSCPHLWSTNFPRELERVRYVSPDNIGTPAVIATSRAHAAEIVAALRGYRRVDAVQMIGKWFDVYRR
jgi:hypothetical protein